MNKILISVEIPSIDRKFDLFIPINKKVGTIKKYILDSVSDLTEGLLEQKEYTFLDIDTGVKYVNNVYVAESGIENGSRILIL